MIMPAKPAETRRLYQVVADRLRDFIRSGAFEPGSRLPPERDLAQQIGVSRPSLREALIALEIEGAVEIRMGSGIYVCSAALPSAGGAAAMGESPSELMQARAAVEGAVVVLAAARATPAGVTGLADSLAAMRAAVAEGHSPLAFDRQFHLAIALMSGNAVLARLVGDLFDERHSPISARLSGRFESQGTWTVALAEHQAILSAIEAGDPLAAQAAMHGHLQASKERWVNG